MTAWEQAVDGEELGLAERRPAGIRPLEEARSAVAVAGVPKWRQVDISVLLAHPTTEILVPVPQEELAAAAVMGGLDDAEDSELIRRFRHVQEIPTLV